MGGRAHRSVQGVDLIGEVAATLLALFRRRGHLPLELRDALLRRLLLSRESRLCGCELLVDLCELLRLRHEARDATSTQTRVQAVSNYRHR